MSIISHQTIADNHVQANGERGIRHEFTDHLSKKHIRGDRRVADEGGKAATEAAYEPERLAMIPDVELSLAWNEVNEQISVAISGGNPDKVAEHQAQADFDRRFLGSAMLLDAQPFYNCKSVFDRVQLEGANANQRAAYLGVSSTEYNLIDTRFNNVNGVVWFLNDEKAQQWTQINEAFI